MQKHLLRFDKFLRNYLYGNNGYYSKHSLLPRLDYHTAPQSYQPFNKLISLYLMSLFTEGVSKKEAVFIDLGAGFGEFSIFFAKNFPDAKVFAVEASKGRQEIIRNRLCGISNLSIVSSLEEIPKSEFAIVFANEFFDAQVVRVFRKNEEFCEELYYDSLLNKFVFTKVTASELPASVIKHLKDIPDNTIFEFETDIGELFRVLRRFNKVWLLIIDYGFQIGEIERFREGTLVGFKDNLFINNPLKRIVDGDILDVTHQVNFTFLNEEARQNGFKFFFIKSLGSFIVEYLEDHLQSFSIEERNFLLKIALPHFLGDSFKVALISNRSKKK
ncbi:MAG: SAM-dependent methyltransferase [Actinobacteria bacterium]|nr:SAM-dependent methyltransferase [Actinomycetota bacterium]